MIRNLMTAAAALSLLVGTAAGAAACKDPKTQKFIKCPPPKPVAPKQCKDAKGKFIRCPPPKPVAPRPCKNAGGKFVKCGTPGAKPI